MQFHICCHWWMNVLVSLFMSISLVVVVNTSCFVCICLSVICVAIPAVVVFIMSFVCFNMSLNIFLNEFLSLRAICFFHVLIHYYCYQVVQSREFDWCAPGLINFNMSCTFT